MTRLTNNSLLERKETMLMIAEEVFAQYSFAGAFARRIMDYLVSTITIGDHHQIETKNHV
jgi:hypothetical protein